MKTDEPTIGYKVTTTCNTSFIVGGAAKITYRKGCKVTAPKHLAERGLYPTFFRTLKFAECFASSEYKPHHIWEIRAYGVIDDIPKALDLHDIEKVEIPERAKHHKYGWPEGTMMAKAIELVEVVEGDRY